MVCLGIVECQHVHRSALDYFLAVLVIVAAVVAVRLLISAVARCLDCGGAAHHHHHHHHSPATTDADEDVDLWGGTGLATYRHADQQERRPEAVEVTVPAGQEHVLGS